MQGMARARQERRPRAAPPPGVPGRDALLAAAIEEFATKGYDGATTAGIARRAGVTQPLVHHHFSTKEQLWKAAIDSLFFQLQVVGVSVVEELRDTSPSRQLTVLIRQLVAFAARYPTLPRIIGHVGVRRDAHLRYIVERHIRPLYESIVGIFEFGVSNGTLKPLDPQLLLFLTMGAVTHFFMVPALVEALFRRDPFAPEEVRRFTDALVEILLEGAAKPARPRKS
jgi:TetR/AcrR family transcriptional regulator